MCHIVYLLIPLTRIGECNSCANTYPKSWCCSDQSAIDFTTGVMDDDLLEFLAVKGIKVGEDRRAHFSVRQVCKKYDEATRKCTIYDKRPKICREFPLSYQQIYDTVDGKRIKMCSYDWDYDPEVGVSIDIVKMTEVLKFE